MSFDSQTLKVALSAIGVRMRWYDARRKPVPPELYRAWDKFNTALANALGDEYRAQGSEL